MSKTVDALPIFVKNCDLNVTRSDDYANLYHLVTHEERRDVTDVTTKFIFAGVLLRYLNYITPCFAPGIPSRGKVLAKSYLCIRSVLFRLG
jgi:hypothetical protein